MSFLSFLLPLLGILQTEIFNKGFTPLNFLGGIFPHRALVGRWPRFNPEPVPRLRGLNNLTRTNSTVQEMRPARFLLSIAREHC